MYQFLILIFVNHTVCSLPHEEYHNVPSRLKVERGYNLNPGDRTMRGKIYRQFPGHGLRPLRPRPNFVNGYQKVPESIYTKYLRSETKKRSLGRDSRRHLLRKHPYKAIPFKLRYFPYLQTKSKNHKSDSPFY